VEVNAQGHQLALKRLQANGATDMIATRTAAALRKSFLRGGVTYSEARKAIGMKGVIKKLDVLFEHDDGTFQIVPKHPTAVGISKLRPGFDGVASGRNTLDNNSPKYWHAFLGKNQTVHPDMIPDPAEVKDDLDPAKKAILRKMMQRPEGATTEEMCEAVGPMWFNRPDGSAELWVDGHCVIARQNGWRIERDGSFAEGTSENFEAAQRDAFIAYEEIRAGERELLTIN
jgi:hypothetical protein